jgi:cellulose synthase/poly-beta-1,6-N-acetylglucosamine synthase-like glycosyltransferase
MIGTVGVIALGTMLTVLLAAIAAWTVYHVVHLVHPVTFRRAPEAFADSGGIPAKRFLILIPARNEAAVLDRVVQSVRHLTYPKAHYRVVVVADQCTDHTAAIAHSGGAECLERVGGPGGKGQAIAWGLDQLRDDPYDAVVILDADSIVDASILLALNRRLALGQDVIQADRRVLNADQSVLTRLYALAQQLRIETFWAPKSDRGLSSIIFGSGFCLSRRIIADVGWTAFGVVEDWEYSLQLVRAGHRVVLARETWVSCEEPHSFGQGYRQRVRWASGRYAVMARYGGGLLRDGIARRNLVLIDTGLTALTPNYSLLANLTLGGLGLSWLGHAHWGMWLPAAFLAALVSQVAYAAIGLVRLRPSGSSLLALIAAPVYLCWVGAVSIRSAVWPRSVGWLQIRRS